MWKKTFQLLISNISHVGYVFASVGSLLKTNSFDRHAAWT